MQGSPEISEVTERKLWLLAETSKALASAVDYAERFQALADAVVPQLADWCVVNVVEADGTIRLIAAAHVEPAKVARLRELARRYPLNGSEASGTTEVLRTGRAEMWPRLEGQAEPASEAETQSWERLRELGCESLMILPLEARGRTLGSLTLARIDAKARYNASDLALAEELARRAALSMDNARLYMAEQQAREAAESVNARLEDLVSERTQQLQDANASLVREIGERRQTEAKLRDSREQLRNLTARLQTVREAERARVAREILDGFGQTMTALKMEMAWLRANLTHANSQLLEQKATTALEMIDGAIRTVRQISADLRPAILDDLGLAAALEWRTHEFERLTGIRSRFVTSLSENHVEAETATLVYRIYEDILSNVVRHALASRIVVTLQQDGDFLVLTVRDNGRGISTANIASPLSLGLIGMSELAQSLGGALTITGRQGKGTTVSLTMPHKGRKV